MLNGMSISSWSGSMNSRQADSSGDHSHSNESYVVTHRPPTPGAPFAAGISIGAHSHIDKAVNIGQAQTINIHAAHSQPLPPPPLPNPPGNFIGRSKEIQDLKNSTQKSPAPTLAITGAPGVGKTALAVVLAHAIKDNYPGGQTFLTLSREDHAEPEDLLEAVLLALGQHGSQLPQSQAGRVGVARSILSSRRILLVIDNISQERQLRSLLPIPTGSLLICTSRSRLSGLQTSEVHHLHLDTLESSEAASYLTTRIGESRFSSQEQVNELADLCGNLPLALHLVSAKALSRPHLTADKIASVLSDKKRRLQALRAGDLSIRTAFEVTYSDLPESRAQAFRALGLHPTGSIKTHIAATVISVLASGVSGTETLDAEEMLDDLVEQGLLEQIGPERFRIHDLLHNYALTLSAEIDTSRVRHEALIALGHAYLDTATILGARIDPRTTPGMNSSPDEGEGNPYLKDDLDNLLAITQQAAELGEWELVSRLTFSSEVLYRARSRWRALLHTNELTLTAAQFTSNEHWRARAQLNIGNANIRLGDIAAGETNLRNAFELSSDIGDPSLAASALYCIVRLQAESQPVEAIKVYKTLLKILRQGDDRYGIAAALSGLADCMLRTGRLQKAEKLLQHALAVAKQVRSRMLQADILGNLGLINLELARPNEAREFVDRSLLEHRSVGDPSGEAGSLLLKGRVAEATGNTEDAINDYEQALAVFQELEEVSGQQAALTHLGSVYRVIGRPGVAAQHYEESRQLAETLCDAQAAVVSLVNLGSLWVNVAELERAKESFARALGVAAQSGSSFLIAQALQQFSKYWSHQGEWEKAAGVLEEALDLIQGIPGAPDAAETRAVLSHAYYRIGRGDEALQQLRLAEQELGPGSSDPALIAVKRQLATVLSSRGMFAEAAVEAEYALKRSEQLGRAQGIAESLGVLANVLARQDEFEQAAVKYRECIRVARETLDPPLLLAHLINLSTCLSASGEDKEALEGYKKALKLATRLQDKAARATVLRCLGVEHAKRGRLSEAEKRFNEAARIAAPLRDKHLLAVLRTDQAQIFVERGKLDRARQLLENAQHLYAEINDVDAERKVMLRMLGLELDQGCSSPSELSDRVSELLQKNRHSPAGAFLERALEPPKQAYQFLGSKYQLPGRRINISSDVKESLPDISIEGILHHLSVSRHNCFVCRQPVALEAEANLVHLLHAGDNAAAVWLKLCHPRCGPSAVVAINEAAPTGILNVEIECSLLPVGDKYIPNIIVDIPHLVQSADKHGYSDTYLDWLAAHDFTHVKVNERTGQVQVELAQSNQNERILATLNNGRMCLTVHGRSVLVDAPLSFLPIWYESTSEGVLGVMIGHNLQGMSWESPNHLIDAAMRGRLVFAVVPLAVNHPAQNHRCVCTPATGRKFKHCCGVVR
ncbi:tetratricopeptide repeat protein [Nonomuraea sp. NPDC052129]|uniref:tetratricopeptide repeat protein n=1 Tax=Nonomuraea sp. NPDC052129 TaxID=3154651 RepID=UPI003443022B